MIYSLYIIFLSMFNTKNNTQIPLKTSISASSGTAVLEDWYEALLPSWTYTSPIRSTIEKLDSQGRVIKREIVDITGRTWAIISITRWVESCPFSWDATTHTSTHASFDQWDIISCNLTAGMLDEIQARIATVETDKLNISDFQNGTKTYQASSTGNDSYAITLSPAPSSYQVGMTFRFMADVANTGTATLNVNWLGAITIKKQHDQTLGDGDIEANQIVTVTYDGTNFQMDSQVATIPSVDINGLTENASVNIKKTYYMTYNQISWQNEKVNWTKLLAVEFFDWSDWDVTISTSVTLVRDMYYNNLTIASWGILDPNWFKIFCTWTFTIASWGIVRRNGNNWGNGSSYPWNPWAGWAALNQWSINWESWAAWSGGGSASPGWSWISVNPSYQSLPWANWWYSNNWSIAGWTWWTSTQWWVYNFFYSPITYIANRLFPAFWWTPNSTPFKSSWTAGGGAWWNQWSWNTTAGGWGWGNGWVIAIFARIFVNGWTIEAKWGNGWAWGWPTWAWIASGGGGWWNWWTLITITKSYTSTGTVNLSWGSGWASWGSGWQAWANWSTWLHINISI